MRVICIKNFYNRRQWFKNVSYELKETEDCFYVSVIPKNGPYAAYPFNWCYRENFVTLNEQRKQKLEKLNEKR